ncbi:MAG: adenylate/guanylate cyclase domain-containing protein [Candidatus Edwardsbacteria bacterium]
MNFTEITPFIPKRIKALIENKLEKVAGSLLLSDISGFTKMSEALATIGKAGTEELTMILNNYFGVMLGIIKQHKGEVLKFGGDALLVAFYGEPAEKQSVAKSCAETML